jgi:hypothetical protein
MRLVVDTLIAVMLIAVLGGLLLRQRSEQSMLERIGLVQQSIRAIESQALYRAAVGDAEGTPRGFARLMDAAWFEHVPQNELIADHAIRPWVDLSPDDQPDRLNPAHVVAEGPLASFWYNAERGVVRARVPDQMSQQATVDLYNLVNGTSLRVDDVDWARPRVEQIAAAQRDDRRASGADRPAGDKPASKLPAVTPRRSPGNRSGATDAATSAAASASHEPVMRDLLGAPR